MKKNQDKEKEQEETKIEEINGEHQIQQDLREIDREISREEWILQNYMDTLEDKANFKVLRSLDGKIYNQGKALMYSVIFASKKGIYNPVVVFDSGDMEIVKNHYNELVAEILTYERAKVEDKEKLDKPEYEKVNLIPEWENYQYFKYKGVLYKFTFPVFWSDTLEINGINNGAVEHIINQKVFTKDIFNDARNQITTYYFHPSKYEYDVMSSYVFLSYLYELLGRVIYLAFQGGQGTGKTVGVEVLSYLMKNGYITGSGTIPSTVRKIEFQQISLAQDEFEKMGKDERVKFTAVMNTGFNPHKRYDICDMGQKNVAKQAIGFRTFSPKCFTCNSLYGFDISFLDRLYVINSIKAGKFLKDIYQLSEEELREFQNLRNKMFVYVLNNWKDILKVINDDKKNLEQEKGIFGRESDKLSIIVGIIKHFKGEEYANKVRKYIKEKAPEETIEKALTMEEIILTALVKEYEKTKEPLIHIENDGLHILLCQKLGFITGKEKYAPSNQKPHTILKSLGLVSKKENKGYNASGRRVFHIHLKDLEFVLKRDGYEKLLYPLTLLSPTRPPRPLSENTGGSEGSFGSEGCESQCKSSKFNSFPPKIHKNDLGKYAKTILKVENIVGKEHLTIEKIHSQLGSNVNILNLEGILNSAVSSDFDTSLMKDDKNKYYSQEWEV